MEAQSESDVMWIRYRTSLDQKTASVLCTLKPTPHLCSAAAQKSFLRSALGTSEEGPVGKDRRGWGSQRRQFSVPLPPLQTMAAPLLSVWYKFLFEERALLLFKKKTEKDKEEKWTLKITDLAACEVTCAFSLPSKPSRLRWSVALEIRPVGLVSEIVLVPPINENSIIFF